MIGNRIKQLRMENRFSQRELADKLEIAYSTMSQYESGERTPSDEMKIKMANLFDVSLDYLLERTDRRSRANDKKLPDGFDSPEEAMKFILEQKVIMGFGGFDINKLTDQEIMDFATELLDQLRLLGYKYKK